MLPLRITLLVVCVVLVQAQGDYFRPILRGPPRGAIKGSQSKYAATLLGPPSRLPKMNRFFRPRYNGPFRGGNKFRGGRLGGVKGGFGAGLVGIDGNLSGKYGNNIGGNIGGNFGGNFGGNVGGKENTNFGGGLENTIGEILESSFGENIGNNLGGKVGGGGGGKYSGNIGSVLEANVVKGAVETTVDSGLSNNPDIGFGENLENNIDGNLGGKLGGGLDNNIGNNVGPKIEGYLVSGRESNFGDKRKGGSGKVLAQIPVRTRHQLTFRDYPMKQGYSLAGENELPQVIEVLANSVPLSLIFRSSSSKINIKQVHEAEKAKLYAAPKHSYSEDAPHILKHTVKKPIYQMVQEMILPYRKITQEVNPVQEEINTQIATSSAQQYGAAPAVLNAYQIEPVLYVSPEAIKSQAEAQPLSHSQMQPILVSQFSIEQQLPQPQAQVLEQQPIQSYQSYEAVQPVASQAPLVESPAEGPVQQAIPTELTPVAPLPQSAAFSYSEAVPQAPVAVIADSNLMDTYMKYAQISAEDLLLPVYAAAAQVSTHTEPAPAAAPEYQVQVSENYAQSAPQHSLATQSKAY